MMCLPCRLRSTAAFAAGLFVLISQVSAQQGRSLNTVPVFPLANTPLHIRQAVQPGSPFTVTGSTGAILGLQNGNIELWDLPTKIFSNLHLTAELDGYPVPIDLNAHAAVLDVEPDHTTITYSHAAITVRQNMLVPAGDQHSDHGAIVFFEIDSIRPATLTISMEPNMVQQWPAPQYGRPGVSWVPMETGGGYLMATDNPTNFGLVAMPNSQPGILFPYQERPESLPMQFKVRFDPKRDRRRYFPLLTAVAGKGELNSAAAIDALKERIEAQAEALPAIYQRTSSYYAHFFDQRLTVETPDDHLNKALRWAEIAIEKSKVTTNGETGLVAGWYPSFDSARPGFGWYFGRDTLWSMYAINSYGDRELAKQAFDFISRRQREDGKIMHEFSLTADSLEGPMKWSNFGYEYAAADASPLYIMAAYDYVRTTNDLAFLREHWEQIKKAYAFDRAHDSDGDGIYDNSQGTGWVEAWPPAMPHQEIYLASLDAISSDQMAELADLMQDNPLAASARKTAAHIAEGVSRYKLPDGSYAFSLNRDGTYDSTATVFPSAAMWTDAKYLPRPDVSLSGWAASTFATDWGVRAVSENERIYDPISYHQGTVWPLFTGWVAMAEYRGAKPLAGYAALMRNVNLTWFQDPGFITEVISGQFFQSLGRSSSHQLWSSSMAFVPAIRGLLGIEADATRHNLYVHPQLPARWGAVTVDHVRVGNDLYTVKIKRQAEKLIITANAQSPTILCLNPNEREACTSSPVLAHSAVLALPAIEVDFLDQGLTEVGSRTRQPRIIEENYSGRRVELTAEALGGSILDLQILRNIPNVKLKVDGGEMVSSERLRVRFSESPGWTRQKIVVTW